MKRHDPRDTRADRSSKWYQLDTIKPVSAHSNDRDIQMRVGVGITMPRKMLAGSDHPVGLHASDEGRTEPSNHHRVLAKRPGVDDRVCRVVVHIQHGSVGDVNAKRSPFQSSYTT